MVNSKQRNNDIVKIISSLDISNTLYLNAKEKYDNLAKYIEGQHCDVEIYPQGSFALGTVIKPTKSVDENNYDLDFICQFKDKEKSDGPKDVACELYKIIKSSETYGSRSTIDNVCITINYAEVNCAGFSIDIVPAINCEANNIDKNFLIQPHDTSILIPKFVEERYEWIKNNPKGYIYWFNQINAPYFAACKNGLKYEILQDDSLQYRSMEEIPDFLVKTPLQRTIQFIKYHRDNFFKNSLKYNDYKPSSSLLTTIVATLASYYANYDCNVLDLLLFSVDNMGIDSKLSPLKYNIAKHKWVLLNPANCEDNLADCWTAENKEAYNKWLIALRGDLYSMLNCEEDSYRTALGNSLGNSIVDRVLGKKSLETKNINKPAKPYRGFENND